MIYSTLEQAQEAMNQLSGSADIQGLEPVQQAQYHAYEQIVEQFGKYDWSTGASGSHYTPETLNPFINEGLICANCSFYYEGACEIVQGNINPNAICKFWIIPENKLGA